MWEIYVRWFHGLKKIQPFMYCMPWHDFLVNRGTSRVCTSIAKKKQQTNTKTTTTKQIGKIKKGMKV